MVFLEMKDKKLAKKLRAKIVSKEVDLWSRFLERTIEEVEGMKKALVVNEAIVEMARKKAKQAK